MTPETLSRVTALNEVIRDKGRFHREKGRRARKLENMDHHFKRATLFSDMQRRVYQLMTLAHSNTQRAKEVTRWVDNVIARSDYEARQRRKAEGKHKFETLHRYSQWYMSSSLGADYSTFSCDRCDRTFYHSPSTIYKATVEVYHCCCGYCTNHIITADYGGENPFN